MFVGNGVSIDIWLLTEPEDTLVSTVITLRSSLLVLAESNGDAGHANRTIRNYSDDFSRRVDFGQSKVNVGHRSLSRTMGQQHGNNIQFLYSGTRLAKLCEDTD
jgi:hypothetical protein